MRQIYKEMQIALICQEQIQKQIETLQLKRIEQQQKVLQMQQNIALKLKEIDDTRKSLEYNQEEIQNKQKLLV